MKNFPDSTSRGPLIAGMATRQEEIAERNTASFAENFSAETPFQSPVAREARAMLQKTSRVFVPLAQASAFANVFRCKERFPQSRLDFFVNSGAAYEGTWTAMVLQQLRGPVVLE